LHVNGTYAALTIGWLDPAGRDGVIADLKTFSALGLHGAAAVTAAGETQLDAPAVIAQIDGVLGSVRMQAVKLTCPANTDVLEAIAAALRRHDVQNLVVDPATATSVPAALDILKTRLLPLARMAVPNVHEAAALTGRPVETWEDMREAAKAIAALGPANVVIKGGKRDGDQVTDLLFDGADYRDYTAERARTAQVGGAGTTFAAAVTAALAKQETVPYAVASAKAYVTLALQNAYDLGGALALHHFYRYWQPSGP
jgi:hydroxymethylpyrimidine/phosphomethylpyrimidine kinase